MAPTVWLLIVALAVLTPFAVAGWSLAPWVPTRTRDLPRIDAALGLKEGAVFYDIGCGDGRVCRYIARHHPDATVIGIEMALPMYLIARLWQCVVPQSNLSYRLGNALKADLSDADALYTYALIGTINKKLKAKFLAELRPGSRIVSYHFAMTDWPGKTGIRQPSKKDARLLVYEVV